MTQVPTSPQIDRVAAAIEGVLDSDAYRAYSNPEATAYSKVHGVLFAGRFFDELPGNDVGAFTVGDLAAASLLDVRFGPHAVVELLERRECNGFLADIPSDMALWDACENQLGGNSAAWRLWTRLVRIPGVGTTRPASFSLGNDPT